MRNGECFRWKFVTTARPVYSMKIRNFFERMKKKKLKEINKFDQKIDQILNTNDKITIN